MSTGTDFIGGARGPPASYVGALLGRVFRVTGWCKRDKGSTVVVVPARRYIDTETDLWLSSRLALGSLVAGDLFGPVIPLRKVTWRLLEKIDQVGALASGHCEGC